MTAKDLPKSQIYFILVLLGLTAYAPVLRVGFIWDDHVMIEQNPYIRNWSWTNVRHDFTATVSNGQGDEGYLRPMVTWSNRLDFGIWGLRPFGYHLTNVAFHLGNALLLYELILLLGCTPMAALLAASLFVVHPIGVEGLITVTGRATLMSFFFGLLTLLLAFDPTPKRIALGLLSFAIALFSKEESVVIPLLLGLLWIVRESPSKRYRWLAAFFGMLGLYLGYRHWIFGTVGAPRDPAYTLQFLIQAFPRVLTHYVKLVLVPWNLHSHRMILRMSHFWFFSLVGWIGLAVWSAKNKKRFPRLFFSVFWLIIGLLPPAIAMVYGGFMLDHWGYWIAPAILLPLGMGFDHGWSKRSKKLYHGLAVLYFPLLIVYALLVHLNVALRDTDEKMYRWALHFTTSHPIEYNFGLVLLESGRARESIPYFSAFLDAYPDDLNARHALALAYYQEGHPKLGMRLLTELVKAHPEYQPAQQSLRHIHTLAESPDRSVTPSK